MTSVARRRDELVAIRISPEPAMADTGIIFAATIIRRVLDFG